MENVNEKRMELVGVNVDIKYSKYNFMSNFEEIIDISSSEKILEYIKSIIHDYPLLGLKYRISVQNIVIPKGNNELAETDKHEPVWCYTVTDKDSLR